MSKLAIIQARMSSSRLPGKVLLDIAGRPMLQHVIDRTVNAKTIDDVVLATTTDPSDDVLEQYCQKQGIPCYRGSLSDVLDRFYQTAVQFHVDVIIRLTADCPLLDPTLIDLTMTAFLGKPLPLSPSYSSQLPDNNSRRAYPFHFAANRLPPPWKRTLPIGLDVEVCSFDALERAWREADQLHHREHVMPYLYEGVSFTQPNLPPETEWYIEQSTTPRGFRVALLNHHPNYGSLRWTVDTPADLEFVRQIYNNFEGQSVFSWQQVLALLEREPELAFINADVKHKSAYDVDHRTPRI
ncbi:MAG: glycosyltransferase family protein [Anaerolineales bacterium]